MPKILDKIFKFKLDDRRLEHIKAQAELKGISSSRYIRDLIDNDINFLPNSNNSNLDINVLDDHLIAIGYTHRALNQMNKRANLFISSNGEDGEIDFSELPILLKKADKYLDRIANFITACGFR